MKIVAFYLNSILLPALLVYSSASTADTPLGWINSSNPAAYTTTKGELEISGAALAVNDSLDVFNYRDEIGRAHV